MLLALCCDLSGALRQNRMWILQFQVRTSVVLFLLNLAQSHLSGLLGCHGGCVAVMRHCL